MVRGLPAGSQIYDVFSDLLLGMHEDGKVPL